MEFLSDFIRLPYSDYWLPLLIGMGVGIVSLAVGRLVVGRKGVVAPLPAPHIAQEYDPFTHGSPSEQRKAFRRTGNLIGVYYATPDERKNPKIGWVYDRSTGGLGLVLNEDWPSGTMLSVRPVDAPATTPWVDIETRNSRQSDDGYEVGCKFVRTPPWAVLLLFG